MAYWFAGFFAQPVIRKPVNLPADASWREISSPFIGIGVRLEHLIGEQPTREAVKEIARELGLEESVCWLYLTYTCWAGKIDFVYGLGMRNGVPFGPLSESEQGRTELVYTNLMSHLGLLPEQAMQFEPFERGYWEKARPSWRSFPR